MPTYEYACHACGHEFEREQRMTDKPVKKCPKCRKMKARRMLSASSFVLKGGGWYADGYSGKSSRADADKSTEGKSTADESTSKSTADESTSKASTDKSSADKSTPKSSTHKPSSARASNKKK